MQLLHTHSPIGYLTHDIFPHSFYFSRTEKKFHERRGSPSDLASGLDEKDKEEIVNDQLVFLSLYTSNIGYLYLLDEKTGVPMIKNASDSPSTYPIIIYNAYATVDKLLPLMQMGMALMRGEAALRVLGQVICLGSETISPRSWIGASQEIVALMYVARPDMHRSEEDKVKFNNLRNNLVKYAAEMSAKVQKDGLGFEDGSEWVVELSFLKTVLEKFDGRRSYAGLKPIKICGRMIWTSKVETNDQVGEIKAPGDYVDPRYRYDAFIHTSILFPQEQASEVSSMSSAYFEETADTNGGQPYSEDDGIPVVVQALSAVCEEETEEKAVSQDEANSSSSKTSTVLERDHASTKADEQEIDRDTTTDEQEVPVRQYATSVSSASAAAALNDYDNDTDDDFTEVTASSSGSSSSHATYSAVLETLGFNIYKSAQEDHTITSHASATSSGENPETQTDGTVNELPIEQEAVEYNQMNFVTKNNEIDFDLSDEDESRSAMSLLNEDDEEDVTAPGTFSAFSDFCAQEVRDRITVCVDAYREMHPGIQTIRFVLTGPEEHPTAPASSTDAHSGILGLAILDDEENRIEKDCLGTADELLAFVKDSIHENEIKEKDTQITDLKNAIAAIDSMKTAEIYEREVAVKELTRKLRLYEEEFYSIASTVQQQDISEKAELRMSIRSGYDGDGGMPGAHNDNSGEGGGECMGEGESHIISKIQAGMKAHLYDLNHTHVSKDLELEQLRYAIHSRDINILREKNEEIKMLRERLKDRDIQIQEFEERIALLTQPNLMGGDEMTETTSSTV